MWLCVSLIFDWFIFVTAIIRNGEPGHRTAVAGNEVDIRLSPSSEAVAVRLVVILYYIHFYVFVDISAANNLVSAVLDMCSVNIWILCLWPRDSEPTSKCCQDCRYRSLVANCS